jgi:hemolysin III
MENYAHRLLRLSGASLTPQGRAVDFISSMFEALDDHLVKAQSADNHQDHDRTEFAADAFIHALGCCLGLVGAGALLSVAYNSATQAELVSLIVYLFGLLSMLALSAAYNLLPRSKAGLRLRSLDHSAIYLMIAGTYTAVLAQMNNEAAPVGLLIAIWITAAIGIALKLLLPGRFDRLSLLLYLVLGWSGGLVFDSIATALTSVSLWLLAGGGIIYTIGVIFHRWESLRFHNAIWHGFVLVAACCHYWAILNCVSHGSISV